MRKVRSDLISYTNSENAETVAAPVIPVSREKSPVLLKKSENSRIKKNSKRQESANEDTAHKAAAKEVAKGNLLRRKKPGETLTDYSTYKLNAGEWLKYGAVGLMLAAIAGYIFYRSIVIGVLLSPLVILYPLYKKKDCMRERDRKLCSQFREGITILSSSLAAGYSLENAMREAESELKLLYGEDSLMAGEFAYINNRVNMNIPVETAWEEFAQRSNQEDIRNFATVIKVAKKTGGDLNEIITHSADIIGDKIGIEEEIKTMTAGKRFEQKIMNFIPVFIILYIDLTSPGFFDVMYETGTGRIIMTACLAVYIAAVLLSQKILAIEV